MHEQMDDNVRMILTLQQKHADDAITSTSTTTMKEYFKKRRDDIPMPENFVETRASASGGDQPISKVIATATKTVCSAVLAASAKL